LGSTVGLSTEPVGQVAPVAAWAPPPEARLARVCSSCGAVVSYGVARYCEDHAERFGGRILCMSCKNSVLS
jgi:hypothetical protein